jgi:hypothetical protein
MKSVSPLILVLLFATTLISCTKEKELDRLAGKWQLVESATSGTGGSGQWQQVPTQYQSIIEFKPDGSLTQIFSNGNSPCSGTYQIVSSGILQLATGCYNLAREVNFEKTNNNIILSFYGRDTYEQQKLVYIP